MTEYWRLERSTLFLISLFPHLISGQVLSCLEKLTKEKYSPCIAWTDIIQPWGWTRPLSQECWKPVLFTWLSGEASRTSYALGDGDWCVCVCLFLMLFTLRLTHCGVVCDRGLQTSLRKLAGLPLLCQPTPRAFSGKHRNQLVMRIKHAIIEVRTDMTKGIIKNLHYLTGKCYWRQ